MNVSDGKISKDEPLETLANILEAIIDIILYGSTGFVTTPYSINPLIKSKAFFAESSLYSLE